MIIYKFNITTKNGKEDYKFLCWAETTDKMKASLDQVRNNFKGSFYNIQYEQVNMLDVPSMPISQFKDNAFEDILSLYEMLKVRGIIKKTEN